MKHQKRNYPYVVKATAVGFLLGLGVLGWHLLYAGLLQMAEYTQMASWYTLMLDQETALFLYAVVVFTLFGFYHGMEQARVTHERNKMEEFMFVLTHDIRTPVMIVKDAADQLEEGVTGPMNEDQKKLASFISHQAKVIDELSEGLLDAERMERGEYQLEAEQTAFTPLMKKAIADMTGLALKKKAQILLKSRLPENMELLLDRFRIKQVIRNLLGNAIKCSPEKKCVLVELFRNQLQEVEMTVENTGSHIPEDKLPVIFDKFVQASSKDQRLGTGLGLAICKNIVDLHHGRIWAENLKPEGVRFHVCLPGQTRAAA